MPPIAESAKRINGRKVIETLALSGGGSDGAFGAGVLAGWKRAATGRNSNCDRGQRRRHHRAFAFLGPSQDEKLHTIWTQYKQSEVITTQFCPLSLADLHWPTPTPSQI